MTLAGMCYSLVDIYKSFAALNCGEYNQEQVMMGANVVFELVI